MPFAANLEAKLREPTGTDYDFYITPFTTIEDLKEKIQQETGIPHHLIHIRHQDRRKDLGGENETKLINKLQALDTNLLVPPAPKEFSKEQIDNHHSKHVDLEILYEVGGGCLTVYRWRCWWCFIVEFDIANGCTECGICANKIASRCKDDGCEVDCCCEKCSCACCDGKCSIM